MRQRYDRAKTPQPALFSAFLAHPAPLALTEGQHHHNIITTFCEDVVMTLVVVASHREKPLIFQGFCDCSVIPVS